MLLRLVEPTAGEVRYEGLDLLPAHSSEMREMRRRMQIVFQDPYAAIEPADASEGDSAEPFAIHGERPAGGLT